VRSAPPWVIVALIGTWCCCTMLDGRFAILTPEGISLSLVPAGPARRAFAWAIDTFVWFGILILANLVLGRSKLGQGVHLLIAFVTYWGYPILCEVYFRGRTLGKRAMGLMVVRADGLPVGWRESTMRNLLLVVDFLPFLYAAGLISMLFDARFRRLGDIVAGTQVVYQTQAVQRQPIVSDHIAPLPFPLTPDQQRTLIDLIERADKLPPSRRLELADLAEPLTGLKGEASLHRLRALAAGLMR